ncbi:aromatic ring-hydroxylating oxygenase subunit alpha [Pseudonocardia broussonetiae]|uniref:Rieske 2Fe-2S domain-containing protein n=1 Tax=Pseudonocardia broussonetiae TaxID=2736640 RepID=A0A6M6JJZ4_9PSEU|nr:aromatic ring-hydroxylating dioxygenase subunit alpha [Pseudonocardia broussonetiae]QJY47483.1 Rieske 2Fe-2S domain-containing protein [Pseudonocardia broussonetiae]
MTHADTRARYDELVQPERVHGSLYTSPEVFADELARIWYSTWVYVGHVSEVAKPNDYVRKAIGPQDVIMSRSADGEVHLLLNRCAHRGNLVCEAAAGNSSSFRCAYHGWTYRNSGELVGYPFHQGYGGRGKLDLGLGRVPRVAVHQGFVFGSFAPDGPSLAEHLGDAAGEIDRLVRLSPEGEIELTAGWLQHRARANWKLLAENETDGYHPQFVHASIFSVAESGIGALYGEKSSAVTRAFGHGHSENDLRPEFRRLGAPLGWFGTTEERMPGYVAAMRAAHGEAAQEILVEGAPHVMIFPNLFIAEIQMFTIQPLAHDVTVQHVTAVQLKGAPEMNRRMLQQCVGSVGPAGLLLADDTEMYERNQVGLGELRPEWVDVRRGSHREHVDERGHTVGGATDETAMRGFWAHYRELMTR